MQHHRHTLPYVKVIAAFVGLIGTSPVQAWPSDEVFASRNRRVEMTAQQLNRYPSHGLIEFELTATSPEPPPTATLVSIRYSATDSRSQWGWLDTREISRSGNIVSVRIPRLEGSIPQWAHILVRHGDTCLGSARVIVSLVSDPHHREMSVNNQAIQIYGKDGVSIRATPRLSDDWRWRFSGEFLEDGAWLERTF